MMRKLGALSLAAAIAGGCLNRDLASIRRDKVAAMASYVGEAMAPDSPVANAAAIEQPQQQTSDRKLIRNGEMTLEVNSVTSALDRLGQIVRTTVGDADGVVRSRGREFRDDGCGTGRERRRRAAGRIAARRTRLAGRARMAPQPSRRRTCRRSVSERLVSYVERGEDEVEPTRVEGFDAARPSRRRRPRH